MFSAEILLRIVEILAECCIITSEGAFSNSLSSSAKTLGSVPCNFWVHIHAVQQKNGYWYKKIENRKCRKSTPRKRQVKVSSEMNLNSIIFSEKWPKP
jgi:hypothetical protein